MGESEPYNDYSFTDGICRECMPLAGRGEGPPDSRIKLFYQQLRDQALSGRPVEAESALAKAKLLKLPASDVLLGLFQPILYEIGQEFEKGAFDVAKEHAFSAEAEKLADLLKCSEKDPLEKNDVLLFPSSENFHSIGVRFFSALLSQAGIGHRLVWPGLPFKEAVELCRSARPTIVGVSAYDSAGEEYARQLMRELAGELKNQKSRSPVVFLGGPAAQGADPKGGVEICDIHDVRATIARFGHILKAS